MLQVFFALAFSAAPLMLYVPPMRSLNLFVETLEGLARETADYSLRTAPRIRFGVRRILASFMRLIYQARF